MMSEQVSAYFPYILLGRLKRDFIIFPDNSSLADVPGGELLYTAAGLNLWERSPGLVSRIGSDYPEVWIEKAASLGFDRSGIKRVPVEIEQRAFYSLLPKTEEEADGSSNIFNEYFRAGLPVPRSLLGLIRKPFIKDSKTDRCSETIIFRDIPEPYKEARCIHFCPLDFLSHNLLPQFFRQEEGRTITMHAGFGYMIPHFIKEVEYLMNGLDAFFAEEDQILSLFAKHFRIHSVTEQMSILSDWGAKNVIVHRRDRSFWLWNQKDGTCWRIPPYFEKALNPIGELSAFCGGFIAGLNETYDVLKALVYGAVASSFASECYSPFDLPGVVPDLQNARIEIMTQKIQKIS